MQTQSSRSASAAPIFFAALCLSAGSAEAAGGAFAVDDSEVGAPGECKVEAWGSFADNRDFIGSVAPACVIDLGRPVDVGVTFARVRLDRAWNSDLVVKAKTPLVPIGEGSSFGAALVGGVGFNLTEHETAAAFVSLPLSFQLAEPLRLNVNVGVLFDLDQRNLLSWGAGFTYSLSKPVTFVTEVFGFDKETGAQAGLRYTPHEKIDFDLIYGHNLTGEKADWLTLGVNVRF